MLRQARLMKRGLFSGVVIIKAFAGMMFSSRKADFAGSAASLVFSLGGHCNSALFCACHCCAPCWVRAGHSSAPSWTSPAWSSPAWTSPAEPPRWQGCSQLCTSTAHPLLGSQHHPGSRAAGLGPPNLPPCSLQISQVNCSQSVLCITVGSLTSLSVEGWHYGNQQLFIPF